MNKNTINILEEQIVYENKNFYPAFPSIIKLDNKNRHLVSFRLAPKLKNNYSHLHSLSNAMLSVINNNVVDKIFEFALDDDAAKQDIQLFRVDEKTIIAYYFRYTFHPISERNLFKYYTFIEYENTIALLSGICICISYDNGNSFSNPYIIKINNNKTVMKHFAIRGSMTKIDNKILAPIYAYKKYINKNEIKYQCYIISSEDLVNWEIKCFLCETEFRNINGKKQKIEYVEPSIIAYKNNIIAFIRTHINNEYGLTSISYSKDKGETFSNPIFTDIKGYPLNALILNDGKLLLVYGYRLKPYGVRCIILDNVEDVFDIDKINYKSNNEEIIIDSKMKSTDCGYPWCVQNNDNSISCIYYGYKEKNKIRKIYLKTFTLN